MGTAQLKEKDAGDRLVVDTTVDGLLVGIVTTGAVFAELDRPVWLGALIGIAGGVLLILLRTVLQSALGWREGKSIAVESRLPTKLLSWGLSMALVFAVLWMLIGPATAWTIAAAAMSYLAVRTVMRHRTHGRAT